MLKCERTDCIAAARWLPVLELRAPELYQGTTFAPAILAVGICDTHKETAGLEDFVTEEGWAQLCAGMRDLGRVEPARARTSLGWVSIDDPDHFVLGMVASVRRRQAR